MPTETKHALKVGLFLSTAEGSEGGRWPKLKAMARHAEAAGFDLLWVADHLLFPLSSPDQVTPGRRECWSILSALAAVTSHIELGTLVVCTSFRNPALLAKMADTVDEISGGRLTLGLGAGWFEPEYQAFGFPFDHRMGRFEESLQIIHGLLRGRTIDFLGQYYQVRDLALRPRGPRPDGPPILIGARADRPRSLRLTARYADYWNTTQAHTAEDVALMREAVDNACVKLGRDPATLLRTAHLLSICPDRRTAASRTGCGPTGPHARCCAARRNNWRRHSERSRARGSATSRFGWNRTRWPPSMRSSPYLNCLIRSN